MTKNRPLRALITGATGFVGSRLAQRLVRQDWEVHVIVRPTSKLEQLDSIKDRIKIYEHDGSTEHLENIVAAAKPEIVFHLASLFLAQHHAKDIVPLIQSNVQFGTQLVEAMVKNGVYRLVNTGTSWQHHENQDYSPVCLYAATKQAFEALLQFYLETTALKVVTLKLFDTYGPDDPRPKLFRLLKATAEQQEPLAMSPGEQLIDLVYIDDVIEAYLVAAERLQAGLVYAHESYIVSSGQPISLKELVRTYEQVIGKELPIQWGGRPYRPREVMVPWNKGDKLPGWEPRVALSEGIKRMEK
ncbi:NAD(P)-dependent oxidoreductase [Dehalococcoidia bacterium]|nr:NAD(P)-dependent oxidoreductase [Dehalococcoidia bacterium]